MSKANILILVIGILLIVLIIFAMVFVIKKNEKKISFAKYEKLVFQKLDEISLEPLDNKLRRVSLIAQKNPKFKDTFSVLDGKYDEIYEKHSSIIKLSQEFVAIGLELSRKERKDNIGIICKDAEIIKHKISEFNNQANKIMEPDAFLLKEMSYYRDKHKMIEVIYHKKIMDIEPIEKPLGKLNQRILELNAEFEENYNAGESFICSSLIEKYRTSILQFANILDEAPLVGEIIYNRIPSMVIELSKHYNSSMEKLNSSLKYVNFINALNEIKSKHKKVLELYSMLNMKECKNTIIWIIKNIKSIESLINAELKAEKLLMEIYPQWKEKTKIVLNNYLDTSKQMKELKAKDQLTLHDTKMFKEISTLIRSLDSEAVNIDQDMTNNDLPYTSQIFKIKQNLLSQITITKQNNDLLKKISSAQNFKINFSNRFQYVSSLITKLHSEIKSKGIVLDAREKDELGAVDLEIYSLEKYLSIENPSHIEIQEKFSKIETKVTWIYKIIGEKKEAANIIRNLFNYFASKRNLDPTFSIKMRSAELQFLSGDYVTSLNTVIAGLESKR